MWQTEWRQAPPRRPPGGPTPHRRDSAVRPSDVEIASVLLWEEHCVECAIPECYAVCPLYIAREDLQCARFEHGICPDHAFSGLFPFGARISFRRWGKLEALVAHGGMTPRTLALAAAVDGVILKPLTSLSRLLKPINPPMKLNRGYRVFRERLLHYAGRRWSPRRLADFDDLLVEAWNEADRSLRFVFECHEDRLVTFRSTFWLHSGYNLIRIPARALALDGSVPLRLQLYPDADKECEIVFTWLDFVRYTERARANLRPAEKVKCVVWDLDDTLWDGTLAEVGPDSVVPRSDVLTLIRQLDERGIVQSIASKNDHDLAWRQLAVLGLQEYFLFPAINWEPKSIGVSRIAEQLNIGLNALAFVDNSPAERGEVAVELPQVRVYADTDVATLLERPEFDVPVTDATRVRRQSYADEARRRSEAVRFANDPDDFLTRCRLKANLFAPESSRDLTRCLELAHRSNQLNLTTRRYAEEELRALREDPAVLLHAFRCHDRFGDYGLVGFFAVRCGREAPLLLDFVMSCRVAKKRVEHAIFFWLQKHLEKRAQHSGLRAVFHPTARNEMLWDVLMEVGFQVVERGDRDVQIELPFAHVPCKSDIVQVQAR